MVEGSGGTMRAAVLEAPHSGLKIEEYSSPSPGPERCSSG